MRTIATALPPQVEARSLPLCLIAQHPLTGMMRHLLRTKFTNALISPFTNIDDQFTPATDSLNMRLFATTLTLQFLSTMLCYSMLC